MKKIILAALIIYTSHTAGYAKDKLLQSHVDKGDFFRLRAALINRRTAQEDVRLYYSAFVDNAFNKNERAISRIDSFLALRPSGWDAKQLMRLQELLMDSYIKTCRYKKAAQVADMLLEKYTDAGESSLANTQKIWQALQNVPPQIANRNGNTTIPIARNKVNIWEVPVQFPGSGDISFMFDTGANLSTISGSYADKLGIRRMNISVKVNSSNGKEVLSDIGVADSFRLGNITLRNIIFIIMPDEALRFPQINWEINGIIGFPVISALKELHISQDGQLTIPLHTSHGPASNLAISGLTPLVQARSGADTLIFQLDSGAGSTELYSNYYQEHKVVIDRNSRLVKKRFGGAGGIKKSKVRQVDGLQLMIGNDTVQLKDIAVHPQPVHSAGKGFAVGNMGQDVISKFKTMTLNFEEMYIDFE